MPRDLKEWIKLLKHDESTIEELRNQKRAEIEAHTGKEEWLEEKKGRLEQAEKRAFLNNVRKEKEKRLAEIKAFLDKKDIASDKILRKAIELKDLEISLTAFVDTREIKAAKYKIKAFRDKITEVRSRLVEEFALLDLQKEARENFEKDLRKTLIKAFVKGITDKKWRKAVKKGKAEALLQEYITKGETVEELKNKLLKEEIKNQYKEKSLNEDEQKNITRFCTDLNKSLKTNPEQRLVATPPE